jgi:O-antigen ligase
MKGGFATLVAPMYLLLCIIFGGSQQGIWANAALQIIAVALLLWVSLTDRLPPVTQSFRRVVGLALLTFVTIAVQLVPLPPPVWTALPGRELFVEGYRLLQLQLPWLPISEAPYQTVIAAFALLPPLAALATVQFANDERLLAGALLGGAGAAIVLGQLQVGATGDQWQLYEFTNPGPIGFFANINHMGTLLLASMPFAVALFVARSKRRDATYRSVETAAVGVAIALLLIGVVLNGSLAALLLVGPVLLASALLFPAGWRLRRFVIPLAVLALAGAVYALSTNPLERVLDTEAVSLASRQEIWATTIKAISDTFPFGTGLGTFETVYAAYEDPNLVSATYVNHAHNDYLQVVLELGAAGILLILLFLLWWGWQALRVWQSHETRPFPRAATITSAAILAHSVVDYPLRTAAIAAVFGMCLGLMVREPLRKSIAARHVRLG